MGTRSQTTISEAGNKPLVGIYRHFDGYPSGHGLELFQFLSKIKIVNGFAPGSKLGEVANGAGCLAAQLVANFKTAVGGVYIQKAGNTGGKKINLTSTPEEFTYQVTIGNEESGFEIRLKVYNYEDKIFEGGLEEFGEFCSAGQEED